MRAMVPRGALQHASARLRSTPEGGEHIFHFIARRMGRARFALARVAAPIRLGESIGCESTRTAPSEAMRRRETSGG